MGDPETQPFITGPGPYGNQGQPPGGGYGPPGGGYGPGSQQAYQGGYEGTTGGYGQPSGYGPPGGGYGQPPTQPMGGGGYGQQGGYPQGGGGYGGGGYPGGGGYGSGGMNEGNRQMKNIWFFSALGMAIMAAIGFLLSLIELQWVNSIEFMYLFLFSSLVALDTTPFMKEFMLVHKVRAGLFTYVHALSRMTFKGAFFLFVGSSLIASFVNNFEQAMAIIGGLIGALGVLVGAITCAGGVRKSCQLNSCREQLNQNGPQLQSEFLKYAKRDGPEPYLEPDHFVSLCKSLTGTAWQPIDMQQIFSALAVGDPKRHILYQRDFFEWVTKPGMTIL